MQMKQIEIKEGFLHIPVKPGINPRYSLQIWFGKNMIRDFYLSITDEDNPYYFFLDMSDYIGKTITIILPQSEKLTVKALDNCIDEKEAAPGHPLYPELYREALRPQFHFSSRRGWLNDPNGLVYANGQYHMYYQHNPLGTPHGGVNICWGHAVSEDLVHWHEKSDSILPWRREWSVASGSAMVDWDNAAGYGKGAIIAAFTTLGTPVNDEGGGYPSGGQYLAGSVDGGDAFYLFSSMATVPTENGEGWRDPRLFRYQDKYIMAVYEVEDGTNCVSFYQSDDFHSWERTSRNMDLYECPDVFTLKTEDGEEKWVLYGADGLCRIGEFDGKAFTESGQSHPLDYGKATYAGQTWSDHPLGKRVHISWVRGMGGENEGHELGYTGMPFSQCMSIPCELTLTKVSGKYQINRYPVEEISCLRKEKKESGIVYLEGAHKLHIAPQQEYIIGLKDIKGKAYLKLGGHQVVFDAEKKELSFENNCVAMTKTSDLQIRVLADTTTMEIFFDRGIAATYAMKPEELFLEINAQGNMNVEVYNLSSIW